MASASSRANFSAGVNRSLCRKVKTAAIFSGEAPDLLAPLALVSIQKGQPTMAAALTLSKQRSSRDTFPDRSIAVPRALAASIIWGQ